MWVKYNSNACVIGLRHTHHPRYYYYYSLSTCLSNFEREERARCMNFQHDAHNFVFSVFCFVLPEQNEFLDFFSDSFDSGFPYEPHKSDRCVSYHPFNHLIYCGAHRIRYTASCAVFFRFICIQNYLSIKLTSSVHQISANS